MTEHIASTVIVIPDYALWAAFGMWTVSTVLAVMQMVLRRRE